MKFAKDLERDLVPGRPFLSKSTKIAILIQYRMADEILGLQAGEEAG